MHVRPGSETDPAANAGLVKGVFRISVLAGSLILWCVIAAVWGSVLAWRYRNFMNPDGISYLDMASEVLRSGPGALVNPHWSPLYPALIAIWEWLFRPPRFYEFQYVHALNAVLYLLAAVAFAYFIRQLTQFRSAAARAVFVAFGFAVFFRYMNMDMTAFVITPDLLVAAAAFVSAGLCLRILRGEADWRTGLAFGAALAAGCFAKAVMLPAGIALLSIAWLWSPRTPSARRVVLIAAAGMCLTYTPQIALVSRRVGHFSLSETGRLNYLWWVNGKPFQGWTGISGRDAPAHGPRILADYPKTIEFGSPVPGTYPLWYDPAYWFAGVKTQLDLKGQLQVINGSLKFYRSIFEDLRLPLEGLTALLILLYVRRRQPERTESLFLLWPIAVLSMYALVFTEPRYIAPFIVLFWTAAYSAVFPPAEESRILLALVAVLMLATSARQTISPDRKVVAPGNRDSPHIFLWMTPPPDNGPDQIAARELNALGLTAGDAIATVGDGFAHFYARMARVRIVAEVVDAASFWTLPPGAAAAIEQKLAATGAEALVAINRPKAFQSGLWHDIPGTTYSVLSLRHSTKSASRADPGPAPGWRLPK